MLVAIPEPVVTAGASSQGASSLLLRQQHHPSAWAAVGRGAVGADPAWLGGLFKLINTGVNPCAYGIRKAQEKYFFLQDLEEMKPRGR